MSSCATHWRCEHSGCRPLKAWDTRSGRRSWPSWVNKALSSQIGKTAYHGVRSTVRPAGIGEGGSGAAGTPQGRWPHRLSRRTRPNGVHPASGCRQVHSRRGGRLHWQATRCGVHRERPGCRPGVAALCSGADDPSPTCRPARRRASSSRLDCRRTLEPAIRAIAHLLTETEIMAPEVQCPTAQATQRTGTGRSVEPSATRSVLSVITGERSHHAVSGTPETSWSM